MSDDLSKVDWTRPIEAYHEDGRVTGAVLHPHEPQPDEEGDYEIVASGVVPTAYFRADGAPSANGGGQACGWRIRNVAEVPRNSEAPSDDIAKRMEALMRRMDKHFGEHGVPPEVYQHYRSATEIVALLEPVDADLAAKRSAIGLACGAVADAVFYHNSDRHQRTKLANALVDLTRALERDSREG